MSGKTTDANGRVFADLAPAADEQSFQVDNASPAYYTSGYYEQHKSQLQAIPPLRATPRIDLADVLGDGYRALSVGLTTDPGQLEISFRRPGAPSELRIT